VVLTRLPSVVVEKQHASLQAAMDTALQGIERAVRRSLKRRTARARGAGHGGLEPAARPR
jgi:ribosome-associated translation inhibitor RaiA